MTRLAATPPPATGPRLLHSSGPNLMADDLLQHLDRWGELELRRPGPSVVAELEASRLVGHGGAWFPVAEKWRSVSSESRRRPVVVANGAEGEPTSRKDAFLLQHSPHLVLDGLSTAAHALRAQRAVLYASAPLLRGVRVAVDDRRRRGIDPVEIELAEAPETFIAGQEAAAVRALSTRADARPTFVGLHSIRERGVGGRPTLVQNVETLANVALIARFGADWFRSQGTEEFPGTMLLTVSGRWADPLVLEAPLGYAIRDLLGLTPPDLTQFSGALLGGYGGGWVSPTVLYDLALTEAAARGVGSSLGAGIVVLLPRSVCPLAEMAHVVRYMEGQGAGQCGPCVHGLADLAGAMEALAFATPRGESIVKEIHAVCELVDGRGACHHPDGVARFVRSGLGVFAEEVTNHQRRGPCSLAGRPPFLPVARRGHHSTEMRQV